MIRNVFYAYLYHTLCCFQGSQRTTELMDKKGRESVCCPRTTNNPCAYVNGRVAGSQLHTRFPNCQGSKTMVLAKTKGIQVKG